MNAGVLRRCWIKLGLTSSQASSFASGAVNLLWGQVEPLSAEQVLAVATDSKHLSAALRAFEERASAVAMWADQYRGSPDGHVVPEKLPRAVA